jgi:hypothetical protein
LVSTYTSYQLITRDIDRSIDQVEKQPVTKRETEYYLANISKAKSIEDFLGDDRLFKYAMKAFGLKDMDYAKAFMRKVLKEGVEDPDSFANSLTDKRYLEFAKTFDFQGFGSTATVFNRAQQGTVDKYLRQTLEEDAGKQNEGVRLALYFERKASSLTSFYQVLADPALSQVVRTALGLPDSFASADVDKQVAFFASKIDIADFKDPEKLSKFMLRFTSLWETSNPTSSTQTSVSVLFGQPAEFGISTDLMMAMQKMKF